LISPNQKLSIEHQSCGRGRCVTIGAVNDIDVLQSCIEFDG